MTDCCPGCDSPPTHAQTAIALPGLGTVEVDTGIADLLVALNLAGALTSHSCQGELSGVLDASPDGELAYFVTTPDGWNRVLALVFTGFTCIDPITAAHPDITQDMCDVADRMFAGGIGFTESMDPDEVFDWNVSTDLNYPLAEVGVFALRTSVYFHPQDVAPAAALLRTVLANASTERSAA